MASISEQKSIFLKWKKRQNEYNKSLFNIGN